METIDLTKESESSTEKEQSKSPLETEEDEMKEEDSADDKEQTSVAKKPYKKETKKINCPAAINIFNYTVMNSCMEHNHPILEDSTIYAIHRKQSPEVMKTIYDIFDSKAQNAVDLVMNVSVNSILFIIY